VERRGRERDRAEPAHGERPRDAVTTGRMNALK
jgi:hypothetical protein